MSESGTKTLGGVVLAVGALGLLAAMMLAATAYLDESDNQDRNPGLLNPDPVDDARSHRNDQFMDLAGHSAAAGGVALVLGGLLLVVGATEGAPPMRRG